MNNPLMKDSKMTDRKFLIYKFTSPSGKSYIGQTKDLKKRIQAHKTKNRCRAFSDAIKKYSFESFTLAILQENLTIDEVNQWEEFYIREHQTLSPNGYNLESGGRNSIPSAETRAKMSAWQVGRKRPEIGEKLRAANTGKKASEEARAKMSASRKGRKLTPETILKMSIAQKGLKKPPATDETRLKLSKAKKGVPKSAEHREKLSEAAKKRAPISEETRIKLSEAAKKRALTRPPISEETRKKISEAAKNRPPRPPVSDETRVKLRLARSNQSAETRAKNSESQRNRHAKNREKKAALMLAKAAS
jgi:group I intron endonuclease